MHHVMGVCCIVFDIDGMVFFFSIFHVFFAFHAISNTSIKKKNWCKKNPGRGGVEFFFKFFLISHFMLFSKH